MRQLIVILFAALGLGSLQAQYYIVMEVKGHIYADERPLEIKQRLHQDTPLRFANDNAEALLLSLSRGYFRLSPAGNTTKRGNEFFGAVKDALLPPNEFQSTGLRGSFSPGEPFVIEDEFDLRAFLQGDIFLVDSLLLPLPLEDMRIDPADSIHISWQAPGNPTVYASRHPIVSGLLILSASQTPASSNADWNIGLSLASTGEPLPTDMPATRLRILPGATLAADLALCREIAPREREEAFFVETFLPYVTHRYGQTNPEQLWEWVKRERE